MRRSIFLSPRLGPPGKLPAASQSNSLIMDIDFKCPLCEQDLSVDASAAGTEIQCPACGETITIPAAESRIPAATEHAKNPSSIGTSAAAKEEKHFSVPVHSKPAEQLIAKPLPSLEASAKEGITLRIKTLKHSEFVEVGKDHFDDAVTKFLEKVGEPNIVKIETFNYTHMDLATRDRVTDYGILVVYRG